MTPDQMLRSERFYAEAPVKGVSPPCNHTSTHTWTPHLRCSDCGYLVPDPAREAIRLFVEAHAHYFDGLRNDPMASAAQLAAAKALLRERYKALEAMCSK